MVVVIVAEEMLKNKLAQAARDRMAQSDNKLKAERKKKAALFAALISKTTTPTAANPATTDTNQGNRYHISCVDSEPSKLQMELLCFDYFLQRKNVVTGIVTCLVLLIFPRV